LQFSEVLPVLSEVGTARQISAIYFEVQQIASEVRNWFLQSSIEKRIDIIIKQAKVEDRLTRVLLTEFTLPAVQKEL
jgi:hypothetical protein